jgi:hypothetical protein
MTQAFVVQTELGHLSAAISGGATSIVLVGGEGASFDTDLPYDIMIGGDGGETVSLTAIATDTLTVSATASAWPEGTAVFMIATLSQPRTSGQIALVSDIAASGGGDVSGPGPTVVDRSIPSWNGTGGYTLRANAAPLIASDSRITTLTDPTGAQDAATKAYVDANDGVAGGTDPQVQWNSGGSLTGAANVTIDDDDLVVGQQATETTTVLTPTTPPSPGAKVFARLRAGRSFLASVDDLGVETMYSPHYKRPPRFFNSTTDFSTSWNTEGTAGAWTFSATAFGQQRIQRFVSATGANAHAGIRNGVDGIYRSSTAGLGGFYATAIFGIGVHTADIRVLVGFSTTNSTVRLNTTDPSGQTNIAGFMVDRGQTNFRWGVNDNAGTCTVTDLGSSFPTNTSATDFYEANFFVPLGDDGHFYYCLENLITGALVFGDSTTDLPVIDTSLTFYVVMCKDGAAPGAGAVTLSIQHASVLPMF